MKKIYLTIIIAMIILISIMGLSFAGIIKFPKLQIVSSGLSKDKLALIKSEGINSIDIQKSQIICNDKDCWSDVYQDNVIQTQWRNPRNYCSDYDENRTCIEYTDYTSDELIQMENDFITKRLNDYANLIQEQQDNGEPQQVTGEGSISG